MGRMIDADALINKYGDWYTEEGTEEGFIGTLKSLAEKLPTIEPEWKRGKWIKAKNWGIRCYQCDQCGNYLDFDGVNAGRGDANFCPNCGADMREESI